MNETKLVDISGVEILYNDLRERIDNSSRKLVVHLEVTFSDKNIPTVVSDTHVSDILAAYDSGYTIYGKITRNDMTYSASFRVIEYENDGETGRDVLFESDGFDDPFDEKIFGSIFSGNEIWQYGAFNKIASLSSSPDIVENFNALGARIQNVADPVDDDDVANKQYVDNAVAGVTVPVQDVQVDGTSVLDAQGVANVPKATKPILANQLGEFGVMRVGNLGVTLYDDVLCMDTPTDAMLKQGTTRDRAVTVFCQDRAVFYGLAKVAGSDEKDSILPIGTYTDAAKTAIKNMIGVEEGLKVVRLI